MLAYLVRHAESLTNAGEGGDLNPALSPLGLQQVERLVRRFSSVKLTAVYCSPFERCLATAAPLARAAGLTVRIRPELHECYHLPAGRRVENRLGTIDEIVRTGDRLELCPDFKGEPRWPAHDESGEDLSARMQAFADYLKGRWGEADDAVLAVSHGSPLARLISAWVSPPPYPSYQFVVDNATMSALRFQKGVSTLTCLNEASHLAGLAAPEIANYNGDGSIKLRRPPVR